MDIDDFAARKRAVQEDEAKIRSVIGDVPLTIESVSEGLSTIQGLTGRVIVRTYSAGVFFGELGQRSSDGQRGIVKNARRLWYWDGAASLSELAISGPSKPGNCKFPAAVEEIELTNIIEVLKVTPEAAKAIDAVKVWTA